MNNPLIFSLKEGFVSFGKKEIFKNLDLNIHRGDLIALVGKNGVGKSTLMRLVSGNLEVDQGKIWKLNKINISYISQSLVLNERLTVEEELSKVLKNNDEKYKIDIFCNNLFLDKKQNIKHLSGGQRRRVGLIKSLIIDSDILLLDEPTNHLDLECIMWLEHFLKNYKGAIICVSHDRTFLSNFTNKIFWLDRGNLRICPSGFRNFDNWSQDLFDQEARQLKNRKQFVNIEVDWANKGVKARVKRNLKRLERAKKLKKQLELDESSYRKAIASIKSQNLKPPSDNSKFIAEFQNVSLFYKDFKKIKILENFSIKISKNDRIGILGNNGTGKTSFIKALIGEIKNQAGTIKVKKNMNFSYFDQLRNDLKNNKTIKKVLVPSGGDYLEVQGKKRHVCSYLKDFMFDPSKVSNSIEILSGGEKNRLLLAKILANPQTGLILDEPTNDLDLETMDLLTEMLSNYKGTLLIVSHDRDFLDQTVNKILYFEGNGKVSLFLGGYSDFLKYSKDESNIKSDTRDHKNDKLKKNKKNINKLSYKFKYELEQLPLEIEKIQNQIKEINLELTNTNLYSENFEYFTKITNEISILKENLNIKENRWIKILEMEESLNKN